MALVVSRTELLDTEIRRSDQHALVMLDGELDLSTAPQLYEQFAELAREGIKHVSLNLAELDFMDSTGLSVILAEHKRVDSLGGELTIFSPRPMVRRLFEVTALDRYFTIRPTKASHHEAE
jgi:anti-anti-sigma factor